MNRVKFNAEDYRDFLSDIENSFQIKLNDNEIRNLMSIEEIMNLVLEKGNYEEGNQCSSQISFYTIRNTLCDLTGIEKREINPETLLKNLFPIKNRRRNWNEFRERLPIQIPKLQPHPSFLTFLIIALISFIGLFSEASFKISFISLLTSIFIAGLMIRLSITFPKNTVGELAKTSVNHDYLSARRKYQNINKRELEALFLTLFSDYLPNKEAKPISIQTQIDYL